MSSVCRLCLADIPNTSESYTFVLTDEQRLVEIVESFTPIKLKDPIDVELNLPTICCLKCLENVRLVDEMRSKIVETDQILRENLEGKQPIPLEIITVEADFIDDYKLRFEHGIEESEDEKKSIRLLIDPLLNQSIKLKLAEKRAEKLNMGQVSLVCDQCQKVCGSLDKLNSHIRTHRKTQEICDVCNKLILRCNMSRHKQLHDAPQQVCDICGAVAKNAESLRCHIYYQHNCTAEKFKCDQCPKFYRYKHKLTTHRRRYHGGETTHICEFCAKAFYSAKDLNRHIKMKHLKMRPFVCQFCHRGFSSSYARRTHERQHTNETPFKCDVCGEGFRQRVSLKTHLKSKHGIVAIKSESAETVV